MSRWIRIQVDIHEHSVFAPEAFTEREAWQWMIGRAAWKETAHRVGAAVHKVPVGSFFATVREMQAAWKWTSTRRVAQFLELLTSQNMIETCSETGKTLVTVCNYMRYQNGETPSETPDTPKPKQERNTKDTSIPEHPGLLREHDGENDLDPADLESKLREAAGDKIQPHSGFVVGPVMELIRLGADIGLDVLPTIRAVAARLNRPARSWDYFVPAIQDAMDKRKAAATWEHRAQPPPPQGQKPKSEAMQRHERIRQKLKLEIHGDENADNASHVIDLTERDYRSH